MIIFLDFDGPMHPCDSNDAGLFRCAPSLWTVLRNCSEVSVVLTTSWRNIYDVGELVLMVCKGGGEDLINRFLGGTPQLIDELGRYIASGGYPRRELECRAWLLGNNVAPKSWLAIDDDPSGFTRGCPQLYSVDPAIGLTDLDAAILIARLSLEGADDPLSRL